MGKEAALSEARILEALSKVKDPELGRDIVSLGMIEKVAIEGSRVSFTFVLTTPACPLRSRLEEEVRAAVLQLPGVTRLDMAVTARVPKGPYRREGSPDSKVRNTIAVASGKGGVGKSTVAVGMAVALAQSGARVGLLDADIHGPSIPTMMGIKYVAQTDGDRLLPPKSHGVALMSVEFFNPSGSPVIWRGPMVSKMIQQLYYEVTWGELDYLVVDLPPGTGDASITMAQAIPLGGVVIVSTPQDVALLDVTKCLATFQKLGVPILGVVENMSYFLCPHCGGRTEIFSHGGAEIASAKLEVPFLGEIPLDVAIRIGGDSGQPILVTQPMSPISEAFRHLAEQVAAKVSILNISGSLEGQKAAAPLPRG